MEKYKKIFEQLKLIECIKNWTEEDWERFEATKKAVEKRISKSPHHKVVVDEETEEVAGECPCCHNVVNDVWDSKHCGECGQALDWKD